MKDELTKQMKLDNIELLMEVNGRIYNLLKDLKTAVENESGNVECYKAHDLKTCMKKFNMLMSVF